VLFIWHSWNFKWHYWYFKGKKYVVARRNRSERTGDIWQVSETHNDTNILIEFNVAKVKQKKTVLLGCNHIRLCWILRIKIRNSCKALCVLGEVMRTITTPIKSFLISLSELVNESIRVWGFKTINIWFLFVNQTYKNIWYLMLLNDSLVTKKTVKRVLKKLIC